MTEERFDALLAEYKAARKAGQTTVSIPMDEARALLSAWIAWQVIRRKVRDWLRTTSIEAPNGRRTWTILGVLRDALSQIGMPVSVGMATPLPADDARPEYRVAADPGVGSLTDLFG